MAGQGHEAEAGSRVKGFLITLTLLAGSCAVQDPGQAREILAARRFTSITFPGKTFDNIDYLSCPDPDRTNIKRCTSFAAVAPWGWPVSGVVACPEIGSCKVHVIFSSTKESL